MTAGLQPLRVAAIQAASVAGDVDANVAEAVKHVRRAGAKRVRLVVLPELFLSGYDPATLQGRPDDCDVAVDDPRLQPLVEAAVATGAAVLVGASVRGPEGHRFLCLLSISATGEVAVAYAKQHLWLDEQRIFEPGVDGGSLVLDGWNIGLGICYDGCFPEHARAATDAGALVYVCPSAYVTGSEHRRDLYYRARAIDNGVYCVFSGLTGTCGTLEFSGGTAVHDPEGRTVARVEGADSGMAIADLDPLVIDEARAINPYDRDRPADLGGRVVTDLDAEG